jgi:hypothetical protein
MMSSAGYATKLRKLKRVSPVILVTKSKTDLNT